MSYKENYSNNNRSNQQRNYDYHNKDMHNSSVEEIPEPIIFKTFYDSEKMIVDLFDEKARNVAKSFIGKDSRGKIIYVTSTQLRKIFDEVKRYEQLIQSGDDQWNIQFPYIKMIKSKVAYAVARASKQKSFEKGVYKNFEQFISSCIDLIKDEKDYHIFVSLFEAAYGFYYELLVDMGIKD